jgi:hypothetical protein
MFLQQTLDRASLPFIEALQEKYPVGNSPFFPNIRVYHKGDFYWELNSLRLRIWAVNLVRSICCPPQWYLMRSHLGIT